MKKILFLIHDLGQGGAEKVLVNLLNGLDKEKFDVTLISLFAGGINEQFLSDRVNYKTVFNKTFPANSQLMKLLSPKLLHKLIIKDKYDIEVSYLEGPCSRIISGCPDPETKLYSWVHIQQKNRRTADYSYRNRREAVNCYQRFDQIACVSESVKSDFNQLFPEVLKKVSVIPNVQNTSSILAAANEFCETDYCEDEEFIITGIGKLLPNKRFDVLIKVFSELLKNGVRAKLIILGDGTERLKLVNLAADLNISESVLFLGYQTNPYKYLRRSDLFVCASAAEGYSTATAEALILGIPVITTPVAGSIELTQGIGYPAVTTDFEEKSIFDSVYAYITNSDYKKQFAKNIENIQSRYSTDQLIKDNEKFLLGNH